MRPERGAGNAHAYAHIFRPFRKHEKRDNIHSDGGRIRGDIRNGGGRNVQHGTYNGACKAAFPTYAGRLPSACGRLFDWTCGSYARSGVHSRRGRGRIFRASLPFLYIGVRGAFDNTAIAVLFVRMRNKRGKIFENEIHSKLYCAAFCSIIRYCDNRRFMI